MKKTYLILCVALAVLFCSTCANIREWNMEAPVRILTQDSLDKQHAEFAEFAEVLRPTHNQLIVRFHEESLFDVDQHSLRPGAHRNLSQAAKILGKYAEFTVIVEGHTDNTGRESYNQWLSERRAYTVADFLVTTGLDPERIQGIGYGESKPIAANNTAQGRLRNRRVELHVIRKPS